MKTLLFLPEIYYTVMALILFLLSVQNVANRRRTFFVAFGLASLGVFVTLFAVKMHGYLFYNAYKVDLFSQVFKFMLALGLFFVVAVCDNLGDISEREHAEFYLFLVTCTIGMMMLVSAVELLTFYIALELSSYSLYILVPLRRGVGFDKEAGVKYILIGATASAFLLFGMSLLFGVAHTTYLPELFKLFPSLITQPAGAVGLMLVLAGLFFKQAVFPFHFWAPDVYQGASNQVTTYIATASKVAAIAIVIRFVGLASQNNELLVKVLMVLSVASMTFGNLVAIIQKDIKRLLAYSSIAHAGYVLIGILTMDTTGFASAMFYALAYLIMNFSCFMVIVKVSPDGRNVWVKDLAGLHKRSPLLAMTLMLGLFGLAGIPPTVGFTGKFLVFLAAMQKGYLALVIIGMINATISLYYYLIIIKAAYLLEPDTDEIPPLKVGFGLKMLNYGLIAAIVLLGIAPSQLFDIAKAAASVLY